MSRSTNTRRRAAELWSRLLMDNSTPLTLTALAEVLQDLAEGFDKRVLTAWDLYSIAWLDYFVAALKKVLRELPPYKDVDSIDELRKEIARLEGINPPAEATAGLNVSAADTSTDTTFKVDTQGHYKARIAKDGTTTTLEFQLNGPATVKVLVHTSTLNELIAEGSSSKSASVPSGGIAAPVAGSAATATGSATKEKKEEMVKEKGESDEDVGLGLFD